MLTPPFGSRPVRYRSVGIARIPDAERAGGSALYPAENENASKPEGGAVKMGVVDERELLLAEDAPLVGWRVFRVRRDDHGHVLAAPLIHDPDYEPFPSTSIRARCYERDHAAPAPGCRCGLYAAVEGTLDSLAGYLSESAHDPDPPIFAEVACTGRVFVDRRGVRAEHLTILRLATSDEHWSTVEGQYQVAADLSNRYQLVVQDISAVPDWVLRNVRPQGAPSDDVHVDLDAVVNSLLPRSPSSPRPLHDQTKRPT